MPSSDLSVWNLILDASPVVQAVVILLLAASVGSWAIIFRKARIIARSRRTAEKFETEFWSGGDLATLYRGIEPKGRTGTGLQSVFESGFGNTAACVSTARRTSSCSPAHGAPCVSRSCVNSTGSRRAWLCWRRWVPPVPTSVSLVPCGAS